MDLLFDLFIIWAAVTLFKRWFGTRPAPAPHAGTRPARRRVRAVDDMIACAECGLYLPRTESLHDAHGQTYCSQEHLLAAHATTKTLP